MCYDDWSVFACLFFQSVFLGCINPWNDWELKAINYLKGVITYHQFIFQKTKAKLPDYHNIPVSKYSNKFVIVTILLFSP